MCLIMAAVWVPETSEIIKVFSNLDDCTIKLMEKPDSNHLFNWFCVGTMGASEQVL